jgi:hypothetical protein
MELFTICDTKFHVFEADRETYLALEWEMTGRVPDDSWDELGKLKEAAN